MVELVGDVSDIRRGMNTVNYYVRIWATLKVYGLSMKRVRFEYIPELLSLTEQIPTDILLSMAKKRKLKRHRKSRFYETTPGENMRVLQKRKHRPKEDGV
jgi:hypothetical protein